MRGNAGDAVHCSDDELLAYSDGELPFSKRVRVRRHLQTCWQCRSHAAMFEKQIQQLTDKAPSWMAPEPQSAGKRIELGLRMLQFEARLPDSRAAGFRKIRGLPAAAWAAIATVAIIAVMIAIRPKNKATEGILPGEAMAHVESAERALYTRPVEQVFAVRIVQTFPSRGSSDSKLHVWSDGSANRFASKWTGAGGEVKQALWQPAAGAEFVYKPSEARAGVKKIVHAEDAKPLLSLADEGLEPAQIERGFMRWMESRSWTPVAFTPELSVWARKDGAVAGVETLRGPDGKAFVRITARKQTSRLTAILTVDVDIRNWWPKRQAIRFESAQRVVEFLLTSNRIQTLASSEMPDAVFHPDIAASGEAPSPVSALVVPEKPAEAEDPVRGLAEGAMQIVEAHYILHQVGACMGEPVKIEQEPTGIRVYNLGRSSGSWPQTFTVLATLQDIAGALADLRRPLPVDLDDPEARVPANALRHAWAVRNLAVDFPANRIAGLPEKSWRQLESMLRDHVVGLRRDLGAPSLASPGVPTRAAGWRCKMARFGDGSFR